DQHRAHAAVAAIDAVAAANAGAPARAGALSPGRLVAGIGHGAARLVAARDREVSARLSRPRPPPTSAAGPIEPDRAGCGHADERSQGGVVGGRTDGRSLLLTPVPIAECTGRTRAYWSGNRFWK